MVQRTSLICLICRPRKNVVIEGLDLSIPKGEFLTMLGPSGSGKTISLMMLAGFRRRR
jgi:ABC-type Fe3+/spermidine/putrescine transport system ATPase subunit